MKKAKNLSKRATKDTSDLAMTFRNKKPKRKANSDDKCYNYHKLEHFGRDCFLPNRRLNRTTQQLRRGESQRDDSRKSRSGRSNTPNQAHQAVENKHDDDSKPNLFVTGPIGNAFMIREQKL